MNPSIRTKLDHLAERFEEITALMADPDTQSDNNRFRQLSQEYAQLEPVVKCFQQYNAAKDDLAAAEDMLRDDDADVRGFRRMRRRELRWLRDAARRGLIEGLVGPR